jgi:1-acyl-sn-glycerol-3-phosphate acyltransferase
MLGGITRSLRRRPVVRVHFGAPLDLDGLCGQSPGAAREATDRIIDALTDALVPLRPDEPDTPRYVDPHRPVDPSRAHRRRLPPPPAARPDPTTGG